MDSRNLSAPSLRDGPYLSSSPSLPPSQSQPHLSSSSLPPPLNLKVMRLSRPSFSRNSPSPFFEHNDAQPTATSCALLSKAHGSLPHSGAFPPSSSLAPNEAPYHPNSTIDFPLSSLLTLPGSFGNISLGETFTSSINVSNDSAWTVKGARLRVEIQATNAKVLLDEVVAGRRPKKEVVVEQEVGEGASVEAGNEGAEEGALPGGQAMGTVVKWEIKELGMHMLVCEVYWEEEVEGGEVVQRSFRKVYKFSVTNPLSVKTKVHLPTTPSSLLSPSLRSLIYLELHIQNTSPLPIFFSKMLFEPAPGLTYKSLNSLPSRDDQLEGASVFEETPLLNPGDTRQVCFCIDEAGREGGEIRGVGGVASLKRVWEGGSVLPLGRMDINWLSPNGEPGRLVTSTLHRRVPLPPPPPAPSLPLPSAVLPPLLARSSSVTSSPTPRSLKQLPQPQSLPSTPPPPPPPKDERDEDDDEKWEVDLVVFDPPPPPPQTSPSTIKVEQIFSKTIRLSVLLPSPPNPHSSSHRTPRRRRRLEIHFLPPHTSPQPNFTPTLLALGPSVLVWDLPSDQETLSAVEREGGGSEEEGGTAVMVLGREWEVEWLGLEEGLVNLGGVRVLLVMEKEGGEGERRERELRRWDQGGLGGVWIGR